MTKGTIQGQASFLNNIAKSLGRERRTDGVKRPEWEHQPQWNVLKDHTPDQLVDVLEEQCKFIHTDFVRTTKDYLPRDLRNFIQEYGGKSIMLADDERFAAFGLDKELQPVEEKEDVVFHTWNAEQGEESIRLAEQANVGVTFSDITLAESGSVVLFTDKGKARSVSLLPATYIAIVPKSTIVPRMSQATREIHRRIENGEAAASCVNFITGPSNSADIEMNLVVGVHGPIKTAYIVVEDA